MPLILYSCVIKKNPYRFLFTTFFSLYVYICNYTSKLNQFIFQNILEEAPFSYLREFAFQWQTSECEDGGLLLLFSSGFPLPPLYGLSNFRHFYARKGGTLKWRHRVVAYGCGYLEITVSVYALRSPRLSSYLPITHSSCNPFVFGVSHYFCFVSRTSVF